MKQTVKWCHFVKFVARCHQSLHKNTFEKFKKTGHPSTCLSTVTSKMNLIKFRPNVNLFPWEIFWHLINWHMSSQTWVSRDVPQWSCANHKCHSFCSVFKTLVYLYSQTFVAAHVMEWETNEFEDANFGENWRYVFMFLQTLCRNLG